MVNFNACFVVFKHQCIFRVNIRVLTVFDNTNLDAADKLLNYEQRSGVRFNFFSTRTLKSSSSWC